MEKKKMIAFIKQLAKDLNMTQRDVEIWLLREGIEATFKKRALKDLR